MRYSYEFKIKCIELYRKGIWPETPAGIKTRSFRDKIRMWVRLEETCGIEALKHKNFNTMWTADKRLELVSQVMAGNSCSEVAIKYGISNGQLYNWVRKYKTLGYNGLVELKKGRPPKEPVMKEKINATPEPLTESEREELIRLRAETEYLRTELAVRKKLEALGREKEAARLKAKRQQLFENYENKDID